MRQKFVPVKEPAAQVAKNILRATDDTSRLKTRSASCWKACAARTVSPSFAAAKASSTTFITGGRLEAGGRSGWLARRPELRRQTKLRTPTLSFLAEARAASTPVPASVLRTRVTSTNPL